MTDRAAQRELFFDQAQMLDHSPEWIEFIRQWRGECEKYEHSPPGTPDYRLGQGIMNGLYDFRPDLFEATIGHIWDPYDNDGALPDFIMRIYNKFVEQLVGGTS